MSKLVEKITGKIRDKTPKKKLEMDPLLPDHDELKRAGRKRAARSRGGRAKTILSAENDRLGT